MDGIENDDVVHDQEELEAFLAAVQALYLPDIFQFTPGQELAEAYDILNLEACRTTPDCADIEVLRQQLLAAELNHVSGRGLVDDPALQDVLLSWGETVWVQNQDAVLAPPTPGAGHDADSGDDDVVVDREIPPVIAVFSLINTGGGGGVDEKR